MVACIHDEFPQRHEGRDAGGDAGPGAEHPVIAIIAVIAMIAAMLLITWARFEVHGTGDLEAAFTEGAPIEPKPDEEREIEAAVTSNRFATGVSPH